MKIEDIFHKTIKEYGMLQKKDRVLVGVSGGPDSIALLHLLHRFRDYYQIEIMAAHLNHNFRPGDAERDAQYVAEFCRQRSIPCVVEFKDVPAMAVRERLSAEQAGRKARYDLFYRVMKENGLNKTAVAHNRDDQVETVLMRLMRGAGVEGLGGIHPVRGSIIRPLLEVPRSMIEEYCEKNNLDPVIDYTNLEPIYTRNKFRLELLPCLRRHYNQKIDSVIADTAKILRQENHFFNDIAAERLRGALVSSGPDKLVLDTGRLKNLHIALLRRVLRMAVEQLKGDKINLEFKHVNSMCALLKRGNTGDMVQLPGGMAAGISYGCFFMTLGKPVIKTIDRVYNLRIPGKTPISDINGLMEAEIITKDCYESSEDKKDRALAFFDIAKTGKNLVVTKRKEGDRFNPLGMKGTKRLKDFFIDLKVPRQNRDAVPIVRNRDGIVWVAGYRMDGSYRIDSNTREVLRLRYIQGSTEGE